MPNGGPIAAHRLPTCSTCGVALDGRVRRPHTLVMLRDGLMVHGGTYCVDHVEQVVDGYRDVRDDVAARWAAPANEPSLLRYLGVVDAGKGGA